jgi:negative regulator of sigma E activity
MHNMLQSGAVHAMERMKDGYHLTAVGEVPAKTLSVVLDSIVVSDP